MQVTPLKYRGENGNKLQVENKKKASDHVKCTLRFQV